MVVNGTRGYCQREASVERVAVSLLSGISLSDFALSEHPDFKAGTFLKIKSLRCGLQLLPLVQHRISISSISLEAPQLSVFYKDDRDPRIGDVFALPAARSSFIVPKKALDHPLLISQLNVSNGEVLFCSSKTKKTNLAIKNIILSGSSVSLEGPFDAAVTCTVEQPGTALAVALQGTIDISNETFTIKRAEIKAGDSSLSLSGTVAHFMNMAKISCDLHIEGKRRSLEQILSAVAPGIPLQSGTGPNVAFSLTGNSDSIKLTDLTAKPRK